MRIHVLQHVAFEGLGCIDHWVQSRQATVSFTRFFSSDKNYLPAIDAFDLLIVLGGPMSVNDQTQYPWLAQEKVFIQQAIAARKPVLGICLGAQLIAYSLGASVYANNLKEIGWFTVEALPNLPEQAFAFPRQATVFHWHGETFDLPAATIHLAKSAGCPHQAFQYQDYVIGLQFHLETTANTAAQIVAHCADELADELTKNQPYIQSGAQILALTPQYSQAVNGLMREILDFLARAI
ncbi:MAG: type 1 glutamine amidotransferase [Moraxellaceae bacterium]|nr:MAG: type 1 glutamine amidotransferase [Moraxellaceae bacterium]